MANAKGVVGRPRRLSDWAETRSHSDPVTRSRLVLSVLVVIPTLVGLLAIDLFGLFMLSVEPKPGICDWNNLVMMLAANVCVALALMSFTVARRWTLWVTLALTLIVGGGGWLVHEFLVPADSYSLGENPFKPLSLRVPVLLIMLSAFATAVLAPPVE